MNILDKQSPNAAGGGNGACPPSAPASSGGPITPSSTDCLMPTNPTLMPPSSTAPSSVSSSSAPHTPLDTMNSVNCQPDLSSNGLPSRPNVSTPSSVFNSSAPNTPMPCPSVGSDANITSPAINHQLDYGEQKMFNSGPAPPPPPPPPPPQSQSVHASNSNMSNPVLSPSPLNVPPSMCTDTTTTNSSSSSGKKGALSNGTNGNKKHCNNRAQQQNSNFPSMGVKCEQPPNNAAVNIAKSQMNFPPPNNANNMVCLPNGAHNGSISPFDADNKMSPFVKPEYMNDFPPPFPNEMIPPSMGNMPRPPPPNCGVAMNVPMQPNNNMNAPPPGKMCAGNSSSNMPPHGMMKPPPMDPQYMQHQSQIFVFNTIMANQAAEAVDSGQFESIIDFHLSNPHTKNFLEKHSLKLPLQNKPSNLWPGNIRPPRMRGPNPNGMCVRAPNFNPNSNPCYPYNHNPPGPGPGGGPQWNGPNNWPGQPPFPPGDMNMKMANCNVRPYGPQFNSNNAPYPLDMQDLTPQQKQHRENKLAILANLQQKLCPELMEPNNRPLSQPPPPPHPHPNEFSNVDPLGGGGGNPNQILPDNDHQMNQMIPSDNFSPSFPPNAMMNSQPGGGDPWQKSGPFPDEKPPPPPAFNGRRKGSQSASQPTMAHQSPLSQQSMNSPSSCVTSSPGNRVPPPPYNPGLRSISSPHPSSPAGTSLSLPSPRMHSNDNTRQSSFTPGGVRSGPATPSADNANCALINSPKSSSRPSNTSPGNNKKAKSSSLDTDLNMMNAFPPKSESAQLMPVPSPKQIDYNTFDGHELVIHKQPNAHFQDNELHLGPNELNNDLYPNDFMNICSSANNPPPNMPDMNPNHRFPPNPACNFDSNHKFPGPDPSLRYSSNSNNANNNCFGMDGYRSSNSCPPPPPPFSQAEAMRFPNCDPSKSRINSSNAGDMAFSGPNSMDMNMMNPNSMPPMGPDGAPFVNGQNHNFSDHPDNAMSSSHLQNLQKMTPPFDKDGMMANSKSGMPPNMGNSTSSHMVPNSMHPNIPQNPHRMPNFDQPFPNMPCSEMNEPNNFGPGPNMHPPNMPPMGGYSNNFANSPRMPSNEPPPFGMHPGNSFGNMPPMNGPPEPPPGGMNGPNSMPMMMQGGPPPPQPPPPAQQQPNVRFPGNGSRPVNPSNTHGARYNSPNIQVKPDAPNTIQYLPSRPQGPTNTPPSRPPNLDFLQQSLSMSGKPAGPPPNNVSYFGGNSGGPMSMPPRQMHHQGHMNFNRPPMMRPQHMQNGPPMSGGQPPPMPPDMYSRPPGPNGNSMMNGPGTMQGPPGNFPPPPGPNKANGPGMHGGESNQSFNFKQSFPNTSDPNYAAQFHNFQQQLYATNTRNSASNPRMTSNF